MNIITPGGVSDHTLLSNIGTNTHAQIDTALGTIGVLTEVVPTFTAGAVTLTASQCTNTIISNYNQSEASTITLPAAASGLSFVVTVVTTGVGALHVKAGAGDKHYFDGVALDDGDKVSCATPAVGNVLTVVAFKTGASTYDWIATTISGVWSDGGA